MSLKATSDLWWKNGLVYCLDVKTFQDSNGDGIGDFVGLTERIDYLAGLGVTCVWLRPFYPSPDLDDGYDVADYYTVDPRLGSLGDLVEFVRTAGDRGIKVIADLVVNHTSTRHAWFQQARRDASSQFRDFYVWSRERPEEDVTDLVFPDAEESNWAWDEVAQAYYLHSFYRHQPDLNVSNPAVRDEIHKIAGFWLQLGLSGFRVDAVPFLLLPAKLLGEFMREPHEVLRYLRGFLARRRGDAILLGEVNLHPVAQLEYFGGARGGELHGVFNFHLNQSLFLALARGDAGPLRLALEETPEPPHPENQWANFVRNHDELTLDQLTDSERAEVLDAFAPDPEQRIFGRGIRRRLPPLLGGDRQRIEMVYSLMFSLPGTPVLLYGEEIGMGDNLAVPGRSSVRTPMQWSGDPHAGFTDPDAQPIRPFVDDPGFAPKAVNVTDQRRDPDSLLNWTERLIRRRRECPEIGWGSHRLLDTGDDRVLAHRCDWEGRSFVAVHNLSDSAARVTLPLGPGVNGVLDLLGERGYREVAGEEIGLDLAPAGYRWLRLHRRGTALFG